MSNGKSNCLYGLTAEFEEPAALLAAARQARAAGYRKIRTYSPFEVHGLDEVLDQQRTPVLGWLVLIALLLGGAAAFLMQYWTAVVDYPLNVGGRPLFSWPAFIPITFEASILFAGVAAVGFLLIRSALPQPYHPIFNTDGIEAASQSRFFLCIQTDDAQFRLRETWQFLQNLEPIQVSEVTC
ncbi:MAG: DUF3341 domain-containing protein [Chloroflexi bacterium]|nr:DUF3341 domain-containing protein [Chloroflexota bacterium]